MMSTETTADPIDTFVNWLLRLRGDLEARNNPAAASRARGVLARLRRGVGKGLTGGIAAWGDFFEHVPDLSHRELDAYFLIATLFAEHPENWPGQAGQPRPSFGATMRMLGDHESARKRFVALLNCDRDRLEDHLRQAVRLARSHEAPINWRQLLADVLDWDNAERRVQVRWARDYFRPTTDEQHGTPNKQGEE